MGYNTTVVVLNDALDSIERDPTFGLRLAQAIRKRGLGTKDAVDVTAENHCNAAIVVETHHSSDEVAVVVGHNTGRATQPASVLLEILGGIGAESVEDAARRVMRERASVRRKFLAVSDAIQSLVKATDALAEDVSR